jgi:hypothetical protein
MIDGMKKAVTWLLVFGICVGLGSWVATRVVQAQVSSQGLSITPAFQEVIFEENDREKTSSFLLKNDTDQRLTFEFQIVPYGTMDLEGGLSSFNPSLNKAAGTLDYIQFDVPELTLEPGEFQELDFRVVNRSSLAPGGHYVAVVSKIVSQTKDKQEIVPAVGALVMIRKKSGEQANLSLTNVKHVSSGIVFSLPRRTILSFENRGNVHVIPRGSIKVSDMFDRVVMQGTINENSIFVLPERSRDIEVMLKKSRWLIPISFLTLEVDGNTQGFDTRYTYRSSFFYISPWTFVFIPALILGGVIVIRRRKQPRKPHE